MKPNVILMVKMLELYRYEVDVASSGEEGVKKARESHPDVVLMDIRMPGQIDGLAAIRQLRNGPDTVDIPIIVISAWGGFEYKALRAGADMYLAKPVPVDDLFVAINRHSRQPSSQAAFLGQAVGRA